MRIDIEPGCDRLWLYTSLTGADFSLALYVLSYRHARGARHFFYSKSTIKESKLIIINAL
jgi:hypothetical protein